MTHILGTGSLASAILFCFSLSATITQVAAYAFSPDLHTRLPGRAHSLSDPCCHKVSYMLPRVTKLPDAGDKGVRPGREAARIKCLAVCSTLRVDRRQTVTPVNRELCSGSHCTFLHRCFRLCHCNPPQKKL